jgi:hypothetical protein
MVRNGMATYLGHHVTLRFIFNPNKFSSLCRPSGMTRQDLTICSCTVHPTAYPRCMLAPSTCLSSFILRGMNTLMSVDNLRELFLVRVRAGDRENEF